MPAMTLLKRLAVGACVGALLGGIAATLVTPGLLAWYNTPAVGQALCNCPEVVRATATALIHGQLIGTAIGAACGGSAAGVLHRTRARTAGQANRVA